MSARLYGLLLAPAVLCLAGCFPEERVWWSPQGDRALVSIDDRLHLMGADGTLGEPLATDGSVEQAVVKTVSWLPDGSGFVCQRTRLVARWEEARVLVPADEAASVEKLLPAVLPMLEAAVRLPDMARTLEEVIAALPTAQIKRFACAVRRKFEQEPGAVEELLRKFPQAEELVSSMKKPGTGYELSELLLFKLADGRVAKARALARNMLRPAVMPRVAPKHDVVAFLRLDDDAGSAALEVLKLDGRSGSTVARKVSTAFEWTPDGRSLVFMSPLGGEGEKLQSIHRITVVQENGALLKPRFEKQEDGRLVEVRGADRLAEPDTLAVAVTLNRPVVQVLADGRVLFASHPVTLPATGIGPELAPRLFVIAADGSAVRPVSTAPGDLPMNLGYFAASPDGKRVAVVEGETDAVAVVDVDTGTTQILSAPHPNWQCRTMPAWKSATELTFAALRGDSPAWMLWDGGDELRCLSQTWPPAATAKWLEHRSAPSVPESTNAKPDPAR